MNRQILLAARPRGEITDDCFRLAEAPVPEPGRGEALVRNLYLSLDPTNRGWMNEQDSYLPAIPLGQVMRGGGVGRVVASNGAPFEVGDLVFGLVGWQDYCIAGPANPVTPVPPDVSPTDALSVLGITGITAYFGMLDVARPQAGETVVVSGAAGATGSVAGQIAKIQGCRVVGIAGGAPKCAWVTKDLGFDACIDYKNEDVGARLDATCPDGIDVYFENVGGPILDEVLQRINQKARIALCGMISTYNDAVPPPGPRHLMQLVVQRARMEGFIVLDYAPRFPEAIAALSKWVEQGRIAHRVDVVDGLENAPRAIHRLFTGENTGKLLVRIAEE